MSKALMFLIVAIVVIGPVMCGGTSGRQIPETSELAESEGYNIRVFALESGPNGGAERCQACYVPEDLRVPEDVISPRQDWVCTEVQRNEILIGVAYATVQDECSKDVHSNACTYWLSLIPDDELQP